MDTPIVTMKAVRPKGSRSNRKHVAFISFEKGNSTVCFSSRAAKFLSLLKGINIVWFNSDISPFVWQFALTNNTIFSTPLNMTKTGRQWRFNDITIVDKVVEAFEIKGSGRIRLYIDVENFMKKPTPIGELTTFQIFDIPELRDDFESEEVKREYSERYKKAITRIKVK